MISGKGWEKEGEDQEGGRLRDLNLLWIIPKSNPVMTRELINDLELQVFDALRDKNLTDQAKVLYLSLNEAGCKDLDQFSYVFKEG